MSDSKGGSKGSDNNSKGDNSSSSSSSDSDSKGSSASSGQSSGSGNSGGKSSSDSKGNDSSSDTGGNESKASAKADAPGPAGVTTGTARAAAEAQDTRSAETYGSFVKGVVDAAPVRDAVGVSMTGEYGTKVGEREMANAFQQAHHEQEAQSAWGDSRYGDYAANKALGAIDSVQGWGYEQAREITQAPLDKIADIGRNPAVKGVATLLGGVPGLALTGMIGITDSVADYMQGEATGKEASFQGLGDLVGTFGPPGVQVAYNAVTNPVKGAKQAIGMAVKTGNPLADAGLSKAFGYAVDGFSSGLQAGQEDAMGPGLLASRQKADSSWSQTVSSRTGQEYNAPQVMGDDAMLLQWKRLAQQEANKPRYSSSLLFNLS